MEWVRQKAFGDEIAGVFEDHAVDGSILNSFVRDASILKEDLGITNYVTRAKIIQSIEIMMLEGDSLVRSGSQNVVVNWGIGADQNDVSPPAYA
ncbi:hypothetical protein HDU76_006208 [Blyttiomyces sp. JEL0837]|nr:hypothetical protein HDU76_006208 [Blyttiomyces sp. JEL0837]